MCYSPGPLVFSSGVTWPFSSGLLPWALAPGSLALALGSWALALGSWAAPPRVNFRLAPGVMGFSSGIFGFSSGVFGFTSGVWVFSSGSWSLALGSFAGVSGFSSGVLGRPAVCEFSLCLWGWGPGLQLRGLWLYLWVFSPGSWCLALFFSLGSRALALGFWALALGL